MSREANRLRSLTLGEHAAYLTLKNATPILKPFGRFLSPAERRRQTRRTQDDHVEEFLDALHTRKRAEVRKLLWIYFAIGEP